MCVWGGGNPSGSEARGPRLACSQQRPIPSEWQRGPLWRVPGGPEDFCAALDCRLRDPYLGDYSQKSKQPWGGEHRGGCPLRL